MHTGAKDFGDAGVSSVCRCMDCARQRHERRQRDQPDAIKDLRARLHPTIIGDANAQKVVRQLTEDIASILEEYDETEGIVGKLVLETLNEYKRSS